MVTQQYDEEHHLIVFDATGDLNLKAIILAIKLWRDHPNFADDINMLWDLHKCNWQIAIEEFLLISDQVVPKINQIWSGRKVACVVDSATEVALVDTQLGSLGWQANWRGFLSHTQAKNWLASS